ncbi:MAG: glycosyltransferase family 2 protein [Acidimicrobiales bacterium]
MPERPDLVATVVVATHNRSSLLPRLVAALEGQDTDSFEVVVVDDASTDDTWDALQGLAASSKIDLRAERLAANSGPATARNVGWRAARSAMVLFTDDDCIPQPGWVRALTGALAEVDLAQGRTEPDPAQRTHHGPFSRTLRVTAEEGYYQTCNIGYRRTVLDALGGFDERYRHPAGEDTDLGWRARESGAATRFVDDGVVYHDVRPSRFLVHLRDTWRWGSCVLTVKQHPGLRDLIWRRVFLRGTHPPALLGGAGLLIAAVPAFGVGRWAGVVLLLPYLDLRIRRWPLQGGPRRRIAAIPGAFVADLAESLVMVISSVRYRTLVL